MATEPDRASRPASLADAEVIEQVRAGRTEAFGELVVRYQDRLFNTCWRICGNLEDARDVTQEAFLKALENVSAFQQQSSFYTWLYRVAVNAAISQRRSRQRRRVESLDGAGTQAAELLRRANESDAGAEPSDAAGQAELRLALVRALQNLDDDHRCVVVLRDVEGFSYQDIAQIVEIPVGTVRSRLHRARMSLREALNPMLGRMKT